MNNSLSKSVSDPVKGKKSQEDTNKIQGIDVADEISLETSETLGKVDYSPTYKQFSPSYKDKIVNHRKGSVPEEIYEENEKRQSFGKKVSFARNVSFDSNIKKSYDKKKTFLTNESESTEKIVGNLSTKIQKNVEIVNASAKSVAEYAYKEERNQQFRPTMEDMPKLLDKFMSDETKGLFSIFDGHGGIDVVKYVHNRLPEVFGKLLVETKNNIEKSFNLAFQKVDDELKNNSKKSLTEGTTACMVYFHRETDIISGTKRILTCANVGDSRALLITSNEVKRLSYDHKCIDEAEVNRIRKLGGVIFNGRLFGQMALSRGLGDHSLKKYGLIPTPHIYRHIISDRDKFVIIASDGVWDVLNDGDVFEIALDCDGADELSSLIVSKAVENGSQDNISCIVIKIK